MKKSLACTVLAGLLAGCVMTGAEAADPIDIVIKADGTVTPNTYTSMSYTGVSAESVTLDFGGSIKTIKTDGKLNTKLYTASPVGTPVFGIGVGADGIVKGDLISEINIGADSLSCGVYNNNMSQSGSVQLTNLGKIVVNGDLGAYGIHIGHGTNEIGFTGDSSIEASSENGDMYGICISGGTTTVTGLKNISVDSSNQFNSYAIYFSGGSLKIGGADSNNMLSVNGDIYALHDGSNIYGTLHLKNAVVTGNVTDDCLEGRHGNIIGVEFDKKIVVNGNVTNITDFSDYNLKEILNCDKYANRIGATNFDAIVADDAEDDFTFGKDDNTSVVKLSRIMITDADAKVKINGGSGGNVEGSKIVAIYNEGTLTIAGDCSVYSIRCEGRHDGNVVVEKGLLKYLGDVAEEIDNYAGQSEIVSRALNNIVLIKNGAAMEIDAGMITNTLNVDDGGKLYLTGGEFDHNPHYIGGGGTTYLKSCTSGLPQDVSVGRDLEISGTLDGSGGTIRLKPWYQQENFILTVGKLAGITNLDVAVNFSGGNVVNGMMSIGAAESGAVLNVSNVNVLDDIPDETNNGVVTYATGAGVADVTHKVNGQVGGSITASGYSWNTSTSTNKIYTFTQDMLNPGKLNWSVQTVSNPITFKEFIEGTYEGKPSILSLTENMVDGPNGGTADSGLASQTNSELHINLNGHTLGTEGNKFTVKVASGKTVYLSGGTGGISRVHTSWTLGDVGTGYASMNTSGGLSISGDIDGVGTLNNDGMVTIGGNVNGSLLLTNSGSLVLDGRKISIGQITNTGELIINSNKTPGNYYLNGDVYHNTGAKTKINLVGKDDGMAALYGRVYGSDENFEMTLRQAEWQMDNVVDRSTVDFGTIHNVSLEKGGSISTNLNTMYYVDNLGSYTSATAWRDVYGTATFHNLRNDGTGRIDLAVDLANSVGDQIILQGETPAKLGVMLVNKDNNGDMEFVPDGVHKVTYAKAPIGSNVTIDTSLTPMYGKNSMIYEPIVETGSGDGQKYWNFTGWTQRPRDNDKSTAKDVLDVPNMMPEMEEKRLEEIHRYAVHKDLSELGAWVRGETGKMSADGVDFDVKVISGGYDWANKTSKGNFFMGIGVGHGTSNADMSFVGDSKNTSFSVYGSWYGRKNYDYIDFVAKYGKIDHEYNGTNFDGIPCSGEYDKKMYSLFLKYGRRVPLKNGFYLEPFGSVTYGRIGDADFYDKGQGARMHVNAILSKIVSAGVMFGKSVKGTELYCKLAYSYDFDGEVSGSAPEQNYSERTDMGGSSCKFAIGASRNLGKQNSLHLDLEKDFGGKMKRPWNLSLTFKHTW